MIPWKTSRLRPVLVLFLLFAVRARAVSDIERTEPPLDIHPGQTREWILIPSWVDTSDPLPEYVRPSIFEYCKSHPGPIRTRLVVLDSAGDDSGTDWRIAVFHPEDSSGAIDTAVLRVFTVDDSVPPGRYQATQDSEQNDSTIHVRLRNLVCWTRSSPWFPLEWQPISDSSLDWILALEWNDWSLMDFQREGRFRFLPTGSASVELAGGQIPSLDRLDPTGLHWGPEGRCYGYWEGGNGCLGGFDMESSPGIGLVQWNDFHTGEHWRLISVDDSSITTAKGTLSAHPIEGETWMYADSAVSDSMRSTAAVKSALLLGFHRIQFLGSSEAGPDRASWRMRHEFQAADGVDRIDSSILSLDTVSGRVIWGADSASPLRRSDSSLTDLFLGFLHDWTAKPIEPIGTNATEGVVDDFRGAFFYEGSAGYSGPSNYPGPGSQGHGTSYAVSFRPGLGPIRFIETSSGYSNTTSWSNSRILRLIGHSLDGSAIQRTSTVRTTKHDLMWLRERLSTDPSFEIARVLADGSRRTARGAEALGLLDVRGPAVFVVRDGTRRYTIPSARF